MEEHVVKILEVGNVTHDVKHFILERPNGYKFIPGQATEVSINKPEWKDQKRPFTFTGLSDSKHLEFVIKIYPEHKGVTAELGKLKTGDTLIVRNVWGAITYQGPGVFIAGGAGITPFIAILKLLNKENSINGNSMIFSNKTSSDIILKDEFERILGNNFIKILTRENISGIHHGRIDKKYLQQVITDFSQNFYICGPETFVESIQKILLELGANVEAVIIEK